MSVCSNSVSERVQLRHCALCIYHTTEHFKTSLRCQQLRLLDDGTCGMPKHVAVLITYEVYTFSVRTAVSTNKTKHHPHTFPLSHVISF